MASNLSESTLTQFTTFGDLLKFLRRRAGLTQRDLSIAVGYSTAQICRLEQNQRLPDLFTLQARFVPELGLEDEPAVVGRLLDLASTMRREDAPAAGLPPFKGLLYFDEADAEIFFGREALTAQLLARLTGLLAAPAHTPPSEGAGGGSARFLAVVGASGSGKSSVVRAGLIPALRWNPATAGWPVLLLTPTAHPLEALAAALLGEALMPAARVALAEAMAARPHALLEALQQRGRLAGAAHVVVVVDQFEELFTLCRSEVERRSFVENLLTAAGAPADETHSVLPAAIIALRADFYAHCAGHARLRAALARHQEYIGGMAAPELRQAMEEPARRGHWEFELGLVDLLLRDIGADADHAPEPGALPLLSHALLETWQRRRGRTLTLSGYNASGGVRGAIAESAEAVFHDQLSPKQQAIARHIFLRLTEFGPDETVPDTRRRARLDELVRQPGDAHTVREVLTLLADARLITTDADTAEVAHEALIREWPTLQTWLAENREGLRRLRQLTDAALEWERAGRDDALAWRGARLAQALEWAAAQPAELNALEHDFLQASREQSEREAAEREAARQRELEAARRLAEAETARAEDLGRAARQLRRRALFLVGALALALGMAGTALFFAGQARQTALAAQALARTALSRELAAAAINSLEDDPERSLLLAMEAISATYGADQTWTTEAEDALRRALLASRVELSLTGHASPPGSVAFSPDGSLLATAAAGEVIIWQVATGQAVHTLPMPADRTRPGIDFSPDGQRLAAPGPMGSAVVWDLASGQPVLTLSGHTDWVTDVAFSPDGTRLATASFDRTARVWDLASGQALLALSGHSNWVMHVAFSPDGAWLATASTDSTAVLWDAATGEPLRTFTHGAVRLYAVAFSPPCPPAGDAGCGQRLATGAEDGTTRIWEAATGRELLALSSEGAPVAAIAFSPDGARLGTANFDGKARLWDAHSGQPLLTLSGHTDGVTGLAFSPACASGAPSQGAVCGTRLATTSFDGTVRIWNIAASRELLTLALPGHTASALRPDGAQLAVGFNDGTVQVWEIGIPQSLAAVLPGPVRAPIAAPALLLSIPAHTGPVRGLAFSPDGTRLATAGGDRTARVWEAATGRELVALHGHRDIIWRIAFSPDGTRLATASQDYMLKVWDAADGRELLSLLNRPGLNGVAFAPGCARQSGQASAAAGNCALSLAVARDSGAAVLYDAATGAGLLNIQDEAVALLDVAFSADGRRLATAGAAGAARVWELETGRQLLALNGHRGAVHALAFNPACGGPAPADAGACRLGLATAGQDGIVRLWDAATGQERLALLGHTGPVTGLSYGPGGAWLAAWGGDGTLRFYALNMPDLAALSRARATRALSAAECRQFLHLSACAGYVAHTSPEGAVAGASTHTAPSGEVPGASTHTAPVGGAGGVMDSD
jgi:WD40 repeat protein